jgi:polyferredoxin
MIYMAVTAGGLDRVDFFYQTTYGFSINSVFALFIYLIVIVITLVLSFAVGKRAVCHYVCWMSPFMTAGRKLRNLFRWPSLRLKARKERCVDCMRCTENCPMSLDVNSMVRDGRMEDSECILCGTCVDVCRQAVIGYTFSKGS